MLSLASAPSLRPLLRSPRAARRSAARPILWAGIANGAGASLGGNAGQAAPRRGPVAPFATGADGLPTLYEKISSAGPDTHQKAASFQLDVKLVVKYVLGTAAQFLIFGATVYALDELLIRFVPAAYRLSVVFAFFAVASLKSRIFSPLNNMRPTVASITAERATSPRLRPWWTPPPQAFPIVWTTIGVLRTVSTALLYRAYGTLDLVAVGALVLHLCIGDTWNTINNADKQLGAAVPASFLVWASAAYAIASYHHALPLAGMLLAPMGVWLTIATALITTTWAMNPGQGQQPLYPVVTA